MCNVFLLLRYAITQQHARFFDLFSLFNFLCISVIDIFNFTCYFDFFSSLFYSFNFDLTIRMRSVSGTDMPIFASGVLINKIL